MVKFDEEEDLLTKKGFLPLYSPWNFEVSHFINITNEDLEKIKQKALSDPFTEFKLSTSSYEGTTDETFLYIFDQLWSSKHQLSLPLFKIVKGYKQMSMTEILDALQTFSDSLRVYISSFFLYKF